MIEVKNLAKYFGDQTVFQNFSCSFHKNKLNVITGESGCGKTTLLRMLIGLESYDGGEIISKEPIRQSVVFQEDRLIENISVYLNIKLVAPKNTPKSEIFNLIASVGLKGNEYKKVSELSGGMKRRVAVLRALAFDFDVLYLDEPFNALDQKTKQELFDFIISKTYNKTVILVTHDMSVLKNVDFNEIKLN